MTSVHAHLAHHVPVRLPLCPTTPLMVLVAGGIRLTPNNYPGKHGAGPPGGAIGSTAAREAH